MRNKSCLSPRENNMSCKIKMDEFLLFPDFSAHKALKNEHSLDFFAYFLDQARK